MTRRLLLLKAAFDVDLHKWRPYSALRSSLGLALITLLATATGHTAWGMLAANGALNAAFPNMNSVPSRRVQVMLGVNLGSALLAALGVLAGQSLLASVVMTLLAAFVVSLYSSYGAVNTSVGLASLNTMIVLAGLQLPPASAPLVGGLVLAGGLLQTALLALLTPLSPYQHERASVARAYHSLATWLERWPPVNHLPPSTELQDAWATLGEASTGAVTRNEQWHAQHATARQALRVAEGVRAALSGYARSGVSSPETHAEAQQLAHVLRLIEASVRSGNAAFEPAAQSELARIRQQSSAPAREWLELIERLLEGLNGVPVAPAEPEAEAPIPPTVWQALRQWPRPGKNAATRYALQYAVMLASATWLTRTLAVPHGYWLVLTAAVVLRQDYVSTLTRSLARLGGTMLGVLLAAALTTLHLTPEQMGWLSLGGAFLTFALFPVGYAAFSAALTIYVVFAIAASGLSAGTVVETRVALTLLGGLWAIAAYFMAPNWQAQSTPQALYSAAQALREYLDMIGLLERHLSTYTLDMTSQARTRARTLRLQAETSVQANSLEPRRWQGNAPSMTASEARTALERLNLLTAQALTLHVSATQQRGGGAATARAQVLELLSELEQAYPISQM